MKTRISLDIDMAGEGTELLNLITSCSCSGPITFSEPEIPETPYIPNNRRIGRKKRFVPTVGEYVKMFKFVEASPVKDHVLTAKNITKTHPGCHPSRTLIGRMSLALNHKSFQEAKAATRSNGETELGTNMLNALILHKGWETNAI